MQPREPRTHLYRQDIQYSQDFRARTLCHLEMRNRARPRRRFLTACNRSSTKLVTINHYTPPVNGFLFS
jgi:hypothetical protein